MKSTEEMIKAAQAELGIMKPRASVKLVSEQSPEPVPSHGGLAVGTYWTLTVEGVVIGKEYDRRHWCADRMKYAKIEHAPRNLRDLFDKLCAAFDAPEVEPAGVGVETPIVCDVLTMRHSSGFPDHFTRVRVGQRQLTLFMSKIKGRCEYHAAELNWLLNGAEKPCVLDFSDDEPEGLSDYLAALKGDEQ